MSASGQNNLVAVVRHAPSINSGRIEGSLVQLSGEDLTLNGGVQITGDMYVPGTPAVRFSGKPDFGGTVTSAGSAQPSNYRVTLNGNARLGMLHNRIDP